MPRFILLKYLKATIKILLIILFAGKSNAQVLTHKWISDSIGAVEEVCWSPDGKKLVSVGWDGFVTIWDSQNGNQIARLSGHSYSVITSVAYSHQGDRIVSGSYKEVIFWDANNGEIINKIHAGLTWDFSTRWNPSDSLVAFESAGQILIIESKSGKIIASFYQNVPNSGGNKSALGWLNNNLLMAGSQNGQLAIYNVKLDSVIYSAMLPTESTFGLYDLAFSRDFRKASLVSVQRVFIVDTKSYQLIDSIKVLGEYLWSSSWSPNNKYIITSGNWMRVRIYSIDTKKVVGIIPFPVDSVQTANKSLKWSPDGEAIAVGTEMQNLNGRVSVWNVKKYLTEVKQGEVSERAFQFSLSQNYPNPFNPTTIISYSLPKTGFVQLKVYDMLGREVASLVNKDQVKGNYKIEFNASSLSSGIYFYRLQSGNFSETKKMIIMR